MPISKSVLGMNARNFNYIQKYNDRKYIKVVDNKIRTKRLLIINRIPTPKLVKVFRTRESARHFDWTSLPREGFVIKPARGYGGEGILPFISWYKNHGKTPLGEQVSANELESHIFDILDGSYSIQNLPDIAYAEELIITDPFYRKLTKVGLPDIRVIVFHKIPVMAMLRIPTVETGGKANLHMGAIGVGIGIRTGITTSAIFKNHPIKLVPGTKIKVKGIKIPNWDEILKLAVNAQIISRLGYAGVDIVFNAKSGPQVLEINARPGLSIQNANRASLRSRLERIENIPVTSIERGIEIGMSLFAEEKLEHLKTGQKVLSVLEDVAIRSGNNEVKLKAKLDTGAYRTSIDKSLAAKIGLVPLKRSIHIKAASGQQERPAVKLNFRLAGKNISTIATIANRSHLSYPMIVGRRDLKGFLIDPVPNQEIEEIDEIDYLE